MTGLFSLEWRRDPNGYEIRRDEHGSLCVGAKTWKREKFDPFKPDLGQQHDLSRKLALFQVLADTPLHNAHDGPAPSRQELIDAATEICGGALVETMVPKLREIYKDTGRRPADVANHAKADPGIRRALLTTMPMPDVYEKEAAARGKGYLNFANRFGLLNDSTSVEEPFFTWAVAITSLRQAIDLWNLSDFDKLISIFQGRSYGQVSIVLRPGSTTAKRPQLRVAPTDLLNGLWIQLAEAVSADLKIRRCDFPICGTPFAYGPGTGRRSSARYCSPKCQKAHEYQIRKESEK